MITAGVLTNSCWRPTTASHVAIAPDRHSRRDGATTRLGVAAIGSRPVLLAFIHTHEPFTDGVDNRHMSRRLLVFIRSLRAQHPTDALTIVIVDGATSEHADEDERLLNFRSDHGLVDTPLLSGIEAKQALREFAVQCLPTTLLIDRQGEIAARWQGLVLPSALAATLASWRITDGSRR